MESVFIVLKYRFKEFFNAALGGGNMWLSFFLLFYVPAFIFLLYHAPGLIAENESWIASGIHNKGAQETVLSISAALLLLLIISYSFDMQYTLFFKGYYEEYSHFPIKSEVLNTIFFFEPVFFNIVNYYIFICFFSIGSCLAIPAAVNLMAAVFFLFLFKVITFLILSHFLFYLSNFLKNVEKKYHIKDLYYPLLFLIVLITCYIAFIYSKLSEQIPLKSIFYDAYYAASYFFPTKLPVAAIFAFSEKNYGLALSYSLAVFFLAAFLLYLSRYLSPDFFRNFYPSKDEEVFRFMCISSSEKIYSYVESPLFYSLIKKDFYYLMLIVQLNILLTVISLSLIKIAGMSVGYTLFNYFIYSMFTGVFMYSSDIKGLEFIKSTPLNFQVVYLIKTASCAIIHAFFLSVTYFAAYKLKNLTLDLNDLLLFTFFGTWLNIYWSDLFIFFYYRKKSENILSKLSLYNLAILVSTAAITIGLFHFLNVCYRSGWLTYFWGVVILSAAYHLIIHCSSVKRFEKENL